MAPFYSNPTTRAAFFQVVLGLAVLWKTETGSSIRGAISAACVLSILIIPFIALEQRNAQLEGEKERLQWEVASHHECDWADPREALGASQHGGNDHRTLGVMQDQAATDEAVSCANSFDHFNSSVESPTLPDHALVASWPLCSETSLGETSIASLKSSVMDTASQAAEKSPTRAPPPPKMRLPQRKTACSEPSAGVRRKAGNVKKASTRALPTVERVGPDPREDC